MLSANRDFMLLQSGQLLLNLPAVALTAAPAPVPLLAALGVEARRVTWFG